MREVDFSCPTCSAQVTAEASKSGGKSSCPGCGYELEIPYPLVNSEMNIGGFVLQSILGVGGMGEVWRAKQVSMDRDVALKILSIRLMNDKSFIESFLREVKTAAKLSHPNIITAYDAGEDNGIYYLATSLVYGKELQEILDGPKKVLPEQIALKIVIAIAEALDYAWTKFRIIHRDIKPGNIMIDYDDNIKLMDMGISTSLFDSEKSNDTCCGTPNYMSPEQAKNSSNIDFRADIYSLGITFFRILSGIMPFTGANHKEVLQKQFKEELPDINIYTPNISIKTVNLLKKMTEKDMNLRHNSWQELINEARENIENLTSPNFSFELKEEKNNRKTLVVSLATILFFLIFLKFITNQDDKKNVAIENVIIEKVAISEQLPVIKQIKTLPKPILLNTEELKEAEIKFFHEKIKKVEGEFEIKRLSRELQIFLGKVIPKNLRDKLESELESKHEDSLNKTRQFILGKVKNLEESNEYIYAQSFLLNYRGEWENETRAFRNFCFQKVVKNKTRRELLDHASKKNILVQDKNEKAEAFLLNVIKKISLKSKDFEKLDVELNNTNLLILIDELIKYETNFPNDFANPFYHNLNKILSTNLELKKIFNGRIITFSLYNMLIEMDYNFANSDAKNDFVAYQTKLLTQNLEIKNNRLILKNNQPIALEYVAKFKKFWVNFSQFSNYKNINSFFTTKNKNYFSIINSHWEKETGICGYAINYKFQKMQDEEKVAKDSLSVIPNERVNQLIYYDGKILHFSTNGFSRNFSIIDEKTSFGFATEKSEVHYSDLKIVGILDRNWFLEHLKSKLK